MVHENFSTRFYVRNPDLTYATAQKIYCFAAKHSTNKGYKYLTELLHLMGSAQIMGIYVNTTGIKK
jgi:hypothetical protein